jgi:hypothetical protein
MAAPGTSKDKKAPRAEGAGPKSHERRSQWFDAIYYRHPIEAALEDGSPPRNDELGNYLLGEAALVERGRGRPISPLVLRYLAELLRKHPTIAPREGNPARRGLMEQRHVWQTLKAAVEAYGTLCGLLQVLRKNARQGKSPNELVKMALALASEGKLADLFVFTPDEVRIWVKAMIAPAKLAPNEDPSPELPPSELAFEILSERYRARNKSIRAAVTTARKRKAPPKTR